MEEHTVKLKIVMTLIFKLIHVSMICMSNKKITKFSLFLTIHLVFGTFFALKHKMKIIVNFVTIRT